MNRNNSMKFNKTALNRIKINPYIDKDHRACIIKTAEGSMILLSIVVMVDFTKKGVEPVSALTISFHASLPSKLLF